MITTDIELIRSLARKGKRLNKRKMDEYRKIIIEENPISTAEGSARVKIGNTEVVAGIKIDVGTPFPDRPKEGVMIVNTEFVPLASPEFESGPPGEEAIEVSRVVDRALRESKFIDFEKLCIREGELVYMIFIDIDVLDHDGNLIDAAGLAALKALMNTKLPEVQNDKIDRTKKPTKPLETKDKPVSVTVVKINEHLMVDPTFEENKAKDASLTVGVMQDGRICSMQKGGEQGLTEEEVYAMIDLAVQKAKELQALV